MAKAKTQVEALGGATPPCAGVAFVTFNDANDAVRLLQQGSVALPALGTKPFNVERPPEPSDVLWENLGCTDGAARQLRGTIYMTLLSLGGAFLIGASAFLQPKAAQHSEADSALKQLAVVAIGTPVPPATPVPSQAATPVPPRLQPVPLGPQPHAPHVGHGRAAQRLTLRLPPLTTSPPKNLHPHPH